MAIKYYFVPEKRQTIAVLPNTKWDVYNKIDKIMRDTGFHFDPMAPNEYKKYLMPDAFKAVVTCDERDVYDVEEGKREAKKKLMKNYHRSIDKRIARFNNSLVKLAASITEEKT